MPIVANDPGNPGIQNGNTENPLFKDTVVAALKVLDSNPNGFFAMFEQGNIDWRSHANDFPGQIGTVWDLHLAVEAAIDYVNQPGDDMNWGNTLLIVTSDHSNSYLRLVEELGPGELPEQLGSDYAYTYPNGEVTYGSTGHTNELVRLTAKGHAVGQLRKYEGAWYPCTSIIDNTQIFQVMIEAVGIPWSSPLSLDTSVAFPKNCGKGLGTKGKGK